jgi:hypothetical protein
LECIQGAYGYVATTTTVSPSSDSSKGSISTVILAAAIGGGGALVLLIILIVVLIRHSDGRRRDVRVRLESQIALMHQLRSRAMTVLSKGLTAAVMDQIQTLSASLVDFEVVTLVILINLGII